MKIRKKKRRSDLQARRCWSKDELDLTMAGTTSGEAEVAELTARYQENIRKSPLWNEMVKRFGKDKAEQLLREFRVENEAAVQQCAEANGARLRSGLVVQRRSDRSLRVHNNSQLLCEDRGLHTYRS